MLSQTELTTSQLPEPGATALPGQAAAAPQGKRLLFIDNLRILLICGVLVVHLNTTYAPLGSWYYQDPGANQLTFALLSFPSLIGVACMGLFFLLAGYFTPGSYDRKGGASFVRDRLVRLGIPVLIYGLLLDPLVVYIASGLHGSYWSFYANYLPQVRGVTGPAWFIALLLLFSLVYAAWRGLTRHRTQKTARTGKLPSYRAILGFIFVLGLLTFVVRIWWPMGWIFLPLNVPVGYLPQYLSLYILGLVAYRRNWFFALTPRMARDWSLIAGLSTLLTFGGLLALAVIEGAGVAGTTQAVSALKGGVNWLALGYALWESFLVVGVGIGLLVLFRQCWNHQGRVAKELAADVYTVYLIHPLILVGFAYAFSVVALYPLLKWGIAVLITIPLCFLISLLIRRIPLVNRVV